MCNRPVVDIRRTCPAKQTKFTYEDKDYFSGDNKTVEGFYYEPGLFSFAVPEHIEFTCPGCGRFGRCRIGNPKPEQSPSWLYTGPESKPTLWPSINCKGCCGWHGWLINGQFTLQQ